MKKLVAALAASVFVTGTAVTSVSAETHEVEKGDSLWNIADEYNTTVDELVEINELKSTTIQPKQEIVIDNEIYVVEKGDTLTSISKEHDATVDNLKKWNDLKSDLIVTGQELDVHGVQADDEKASAKKATESKKETKEASETEAKSEPKKAEASSEQNDEKSPEGKTISVEATAYTGQCDGCSGVTSTGVDLNANPDAKVIAVDPSVIPLGSKVHVEGYGEATAADVGSAIKGNKIDVHVPTKGEANSWGVKTVNVTIVE